MTRATAKTKPPAGYTATGEYLPPTSSDGNPLPPLRPGVAIVRRDDAVPVDLLHEFHRNPNKGDVKLIRESIDTNGLFRGVVANVGTLTGRPFEVLAGNHTLKATIEDGQPWIAVDWVDVDDAGCVRIMSVDNAAAKKARMDTDVLAELLVDLDDLVGTGVTTDELLKMQGLEEQDTDEQLVASFALIVDCDDETQQAELLVKFEDEGLRVRPLMM